MQKKSLCVLNKKQKKTSGWINDGRILWYGSLSASQQTCLDFPVPASTLTPTRLLLQHLNGACVQNTSSVRPPFRSICRTGGRDIYYRLTESFKRIHLVSLHPRGPSLCLGNERVEQTNARRARAEVTTWVGVLQDGTAVPSGCFSCSPCWWGSDVRSNFSFPYCVGAYRADAEGGPPLAPFLSVFPSRFGRLTRLVNLSINFSIRLWSRFTPLAIFLHPHQSEVCVLRVFPRYL